jgi:hypothetical protein
MADLWQFIDDIDADKQAMLVKRLEDRAQMPKFAEIRELPHFHPDEWRTGVVLSGNYHFGLGEQWDESKLRAYPAGTFFSEPKGVWAKDGEVIVQFTAMGPTGLTLIPQKQ